MIYIVVVFDPIDEENKYYGPFDDQRDAELWIKDALDLDDQRLASIAPLAEPEGEF